MKDTLTSQNFQDFRQRYRGTFGLYSPSEDRKILVRLTEVDSDQVIFEDARGGSYNVRANSGIPFDFFSVERQLYNNNGAVLYVHRKPARQWQRGISDANTTITNLVTGSNVSVNFLNIQSLFDASSKYRTAVEQLVAGKVKNAALSKRFAVVEGKLYMFDTPIGRYENGVATVEELYSQEFTDLVKRNNYEITIK